MKVERWHDELKQFSGNNDIIILMVGNKADLHT